MSGPFDPEDAYWAALRQSPAFVPAWNAALWEAAKLVSDPSLTRKDVSEALRHLTRRRGGGK